MHHSRRCAADQIQILCLFGSLALAVCFRINQSVESNRALLVRRGGKGDRYCSPHSRCVYPALYTYIALLSGGILLFSLAPPTHNIRRMKNIKAGALHVNAHTTVTRYKNNESSQQKRIRTILLFATSSAARPLFARPGRFPFSIVPARALESFALLSIRRQKPAGGAGVRKRTKLLNAFRLRTRFGDFRYK